VAASIGKSLADRKWSGHVGCERRKSRLCRCEPRGPWLRASANRAPSHGGEESRGVLSSESDDDGDGTQARLREQQAQTKPARAASPEK
jgi:hypothetical protein